jgi:hypothetical protein
MKTKKLIGLAAAAVILGSLAFISNNSKKVKTPQETGKPVLPQLNLSKVQQIELNMKSGKKLVVKSSETGWTLSSLYDFPADITKIRSNLQSIKDMKIGQSASSSKVANADLIDLQDESGKSLASLRIGDQHMREATGQMAMYGGGSFPDGRYVSAGGEDKAYLVTETLRQITESPANWADVEIANIPSADISGIALMTGNDAVVLSKSDGSWTLAGLKENEEFDTSKSYSLESALSSLSFETLADPAMSAEQLGISTGMVFKAMLKNGESYTAKLGNMMPDNSGRYMKISAAFTPQGTNATINAGLKSKIADFNKKTAQWNYVIPSQKAGNMILTRSDLVKEKKKEEKVEEKVK